MKPTPEWTSKHTLSSKLKIANLVTSGTVILLSTIFLLGIQIYLFTSSLVRQTETQAKMVSENISAAIVFGDKKAATDILATLHAASEIKFAAVYDNNNNEFATFSRDPNYVFKSDSPRGLQNSYSISLRHLFFHYPIVLNQNLVGAVVLHTEMTGFYKQVILYLLVTIPVMIGVLAIANLMLSRLQRSIMEPIVMLSEISKNISEYGDYSVRAEIKSSQDIMALADAFNGMLNRIQKRETDLQAEILERKRVQVKLDRLAHYDNVTGLNNRHFFNDRLESVITRSEKFMEKTVLMFIDLDNFKTVNDTLGHDVGDKLLQLVAERLANTVRFGDVACRIGGDEFAIILENVSELSVASMIAEKCLAALAQPIEISGNELHIGASIGVSVYPDDAQDKYSLLKYADTAMYYAKNGGKNAYRLFEQSMQENAQKRFTMENNLRRAMEREEFVLHYQPQIDVTSGQISGVEALIRWVHPELGIITPAEFIPIAEDTGLIVEIGEWVIQEACLEMKRWHEDGHKLRVAVNLSGRQLKERDFVKNVLAIVEKTGIEPEYLELELTESMLMEASAGIIEKLFDLKAAGIQLAIDDFGTGYSSMSYLKAFPVTCLKVDRSFIRDLPQNTEDAAITKAIIAMAKSLRMKVVAEGIENVEQGDFLREHGCDEYQGYFYSKPVLAEEIRKMLPKSLVSRVA
ncbi:EAL domain-containing protein [Noviherbaspirillum soli]|uniref:EAL domain-containing protein n=1 Tax=Noviherbaspirillum soli TaxID=1064518 RepID=UPI00188CB6EE|nr:EAL domain-containing protein [Noviherbaspirillum soli]